MFYKPMLLPLLAQVFLTFVVWFYLYALRIPEIRSKGIDLKDLKDRAEGHRLLPVSDLPNVDFPTIQVLAALPGANPETMASSVATPLEREFTTRMVHQGYIEPHAVVVMDADGQDRPEAIPRLGGALQANGSTRIDGQLSPVRAGVLEPADADSVPSEESKVNTGTYPPFGMSMRTRPSAFHGPGSWRNLISSGSAVRQSICETSISGPSNVFETARMCSFARYSGSLINRGMMSLTAILMGTRQ